MNLTDFGLESQGAARTLDFDFLAHIEYGFSAGLKGAYQKFDADQDLNSANARISWTKGARWNNVVLPQLAGFYDPDDVLHSSLFDRNSRWGHLNPVVHLTSETTVELLTGANFDGVYFPDSAYDYVPTPSTGVCLLGAALCKSSRRKR